jgi:hypothetical protein
MAAGDAGDWRRVGLAVRGGAGGSPQFLSKLRDVEIQASCGFWSFTQPSMIQHQHTLAVQEVHCVKTFSTRNAAVSLILLAMHEQHYVS